MKHLLLTTIAAVVLVGCGKSQTSSSQVEAAEPVAGASQPEPQTAEAPDISISDAAAKGNIEAVKKHLAAGTDVNVKYEMGTTTLHDAAFSGHKETVELLIAKGADVNVQNDFDQTPLDWAIQFKKPEIIPLLRKHGGKTGEELKAEGK